MKETLLDFSKMLFVIIVISLLVVLYMYLFEFADYLLGVNYKLAFGVTTFLMLSIGALVMSVMMYIGSKNEVKKV